MNRPNNIRESYRPGADSHYGVAAGTEVCL